MRTRGDNASRAMKLAAALIVLPIVLCSCAIFDKGPVRNEGGVAAPDEPIAVQNVSAGTILDYFSEVAFGSEYGESEGVVCKWNKKVKYRVEGDATDADRELIGRLCDRLNEIDGFPGISEAFVSSSANFVVSFISRDEIVSSFEHADSSCAGMAQYEWDGETGEIISARCAIDSALGADRQNTICEEFLQSLGPAQDSYMFSESAFYEGYTLMPFPADVDFAVMALLYSTRIPSGTPRLEAISLAAQLLDWDRTGR